MHNSAQSSITSSTAAVSERRQAPRTPERVHLIARGTPGGWDETVSSTIDPPTRHDGLRSDARKIMNRELDHNTPALPRGDPPCQGKPCDAVRRDRLKRDEGEQGLHAFC
jgi:hypothetical protein